MKPKLILYAAVALIISAIAITTCNSKADRENESVLNSYTHLAKQFKAEKLALSIRYENEIAVLSEKNADLRTEAEKSKLSLSAYRLKANVLEAELKTAIAAGDTTHLQSLSESYFESRVKTDSLCDSTISKLDSIVANRDSVIVIQNLAADNSKELQKQQEVQVQLLTDALNTAYKVQRKKVMQSRLVAFGTMFIAGAVTTVVIKQKLK